MSFSSGSVVGNGKSNRHSSGSHYARGGCCSKGNWSGINIAAMVIGFILFWPLGLVVLYWNITGRDLKELPAAFQELWAKFTSASSRHGTATYAKSDNAVFDEYQQTQYDRIREIKDEIVNRARRFSHFREDAKRRAEEKEFKDFMANNPDSAQK